MFRDIEKPYAVTWTEMSEGVRCVDKREEFSKKTQAEAKMKELEKVPEVISYKLNKTITVWEK